MMEVLAKNTVSLCFSHHTQTSGFRLNKTSAFHVALDLLSLSLSLYPSHHLPTSVFPQYQELQ